MNNKEKCPKCGTVYKDEWLIDNNNEIDFPVYKCTKCNYKG